MPNELDDKDEFEKDPNACPECHVVCPCRCVDCKPYGPGKGPLTLHALRIITHRHIRDMNA